MTGLIAIVTALAVASVFVLVVEYTIHSAIYSSIAGAVGGGVGQRLGLRLAGLTVSRDDEWLSHLQFEQIYRLHLLYCYSILFISIACGSAIGLSIHYWNNSKNPVHENSR